jgi:hypothetical protein
MELLITVLITFGVVNSGDADKLSNDSATVHELVQKNNITQKQIDDYEDSIIGLEESDL